MNSKPFALLIIILLVNCSCISATRTFDNNFSRSNTVSNYTNNSNDDFDNLNYNEMLHFLLRGKNLPEYMVMTGNGSNFTTYTFRKSDKIPDGYHPLSDNYHGMDFQDDTWKSTIFHQPKAHIPCIFLINNNDSVDLVNYWCFTYDLINTQKYETDVINLPKINFPYPLNDNATQLKRDITDNPLTTCEKIDDWSSETYKEVHEGLTAIETQSAPSRAQNMMISKIRLEPGDYYWVPDIYGGYFENVDDLSLKDMNIVEQGMKSLLGDAKDQLLTVILVLQTINLGLEHAKVLNPLEFLQKPIEIAILVNKDYINILQWKLNNIQHIYWICDRDTMLISGEKDYREELRNNQRMKEDPTKEEKTQKNQRIDDQIKVIKDNVKEQHDMLYNREFL